jgi:hypothetical protein
MTWRHSECVWTFSERLATKASERRSNLLEVVQLRSRADRVVAALAAQRHECVAVVMDRRHFITILGCVLAAPVAIHRARILWTAGRLRLPTMFQAKEYTEDGALLAYLPSYADQGGARRSTLIGS